jgi:hypothetical protein
MSPAFENQPQDDVSRRRFLLAAGISALALSFPLPVFSGKLKGERMGIVVHSYGLRWNSKANSSTYPPFNNAIQLLEHCHSIGAGGIQVGVSGWTPDFALQIRKRSETLNLFLEGSIGLPKTEKDIENFEDQVIQAKQAGVQVLRTVCLSGRRYETFKTEMEFEVFRKNSIQSEPIPWENHQRWFKNKLADADAKLFILEWRSKPVAQIRFDLIDDVYTLSFLVDSKFRGVGLANKILLMGILALNSVKSILAFVKPENTKSERVFISYGFQYIGMETHNKVVLKKYLLKP